MLSNFANQIEGFMMLVGTNTDIYIYTKQILSMILSQSIKFMTVYHWLVYDDI